jgi:uncharacterized protein YabE (DUF348 family)
MPHIFMKKRLLFSFILITMLGIGLVSRTSTEAHAENTRVVNIHIDGQEKTIATNASNVQEVLENFGAKIGKHDKTEPALNHPVKGSDFTINVYRARPITVVDGANNYTVITAERSPRQIAQDAGFETKQEDEFNFERSDNPFEGAPGTQMVIKRAKTITFDLYGTASQMSTNETSVKGLLEDRAVELDPEDEVNVPLEARIVEGMTISIAKINKNVETVEEVAPFEEEKINDAQQPTSYRKVQTPGKNGKKLVTYEVVSRNGGEPVRTAVKEVITEEPTKQVVVVGAKQVVNAPGNCGEWLAQAGISNADAVWLIAKESGCNPGAVNKSSGACGIPQALPCSKLPCPLDASGAVCQLGWMDRYVHGRYGSWAAARAFHAQRGWY